MNIPVLHNGLLIPQEFLEIYEGSNILRIGTPDTVRGSISIHSDASFDPLRVLNTKFSKNATQISLYGASSVSISHSGYFRWLLGSQYIYIPFMV